MSPLIPAAEYVRMSTDDQPNSLPFQRETIRRYAEEHGFEVIATYSDPGRSGIEIRHRPGIQQLLQDVTAGKTIFKAILVYDVSRWGRFQDTDESAYYEFICRSSGIPIHYCAEQFQNDGTFPSSIMKALKRTMAAEFSRELSVKVCAAQRRIAVAGFRVGGRPGYGLRRMLISSDGRRKRYLHLNERKGIAADGVVLVPGPRPEVDCVRTIFTLAADRQNTPRWIAQEMNRRKIKFVDGRKWSELSVYRILKNEKYMGVHAWGKTTKSLGSNRTKPPEQWIRKDGAFPAIVTAEQFARAQTMMQKRKTWPRKPLEFAIAKMRKVLSREGRLSEHLLRKHGALCYRRFGSVMRAYEAIGYRPSSRAMKGVAVRKKMRQLRSGVLLEFSELFPSDVRMVRLPGQMQRQVLELEHRLLVALHICRPSTPTLAGEPRWVLIGQPKEKDLPALIGTSDETVSNIRDFFVVPPLGKTKRCTVIGEHHPFLLLARRLDCLYQFVTVVKQMMAHWIPEKEVTARGDVLFTARTSSVSLAGEEVYLSNIQHKMFRLLVENAGNPVSREKLAKVGAHGVTHPSKRTKDPLRAFVRSHIAELRRKLGPWGSRIVTVIGQGYVYDPKAKISSRGKKDSKLYLPRITEPLGSQMLFAAIKQIA
jgi:DNA invertase Pin-like site-specific DNA recombinase/DNA-binding winged helix-turn-helix (wHTH) protein